MKERPWHGGQTVYYSERYGYNNAYPNPNELFEQLKRAFGDKIIQDFGVVTTGWVLAECDGYDKATKALSLNGNVELVSFDRATAESNVNSIFIPLKERDYSDYHDCYKTASITITSDPSNSAVYSNEEYIGQTPCHITVNWKSPKNRKEIRFERSGFITNRRMITPEEEKIHVVLQPMY